MGVPILHALHWGALAGTGPERAYWLGVGSEHSWRVSLGLLDDLTEHRSWYGVAGNRFGVGNGGIQLVGLVANGADTRTGLSVNPTEQTTASVQQIIPPIPALPVNGETATVVGSGVVGLIFSILFLRRKTSRDKLEILKDGTEGLMLRTAIDERAKAMQDARDAWSEKTSDARIIGQITAENEYLKRELAAAQEQIARIRRGVQVIGHNVDRVEEGLSKASNNLDDNASP